MNLTHQEIILRPLMTERSMQNQAIGKYTFQVHPHANKIQIRNAVEILFKVNVAKVNALHVRGKMRVFGKSIGKKPDWKKAIVTLKPGEKIIMKGIEMFEE